jgi:dihydrofolate synthase / folylpolyglutamate synthase
VNRQLISEKEVTRLVEEIQPLLKEFPADHHPTFFEVVTVLALKYFSAQKCDLVIWETGLGGRLDATNIVTPLASVITNIALDHQQWLGDTLKKIAAEKAGIIKPAVPVVTGTDAPEALAVIEEVAREKEAPLTSMATDVDPQLNSKISAVLSRKTTTLALVGDYQKLNATLALATVEILQSKIPVSDEAIHTGLATVSWPGRLQLIQQPDDRKILLDGAHNAAGAVVLRAALEKQFADRRPVIIFGALADKKWEEICAILAPVAAKVYTVSVASERSANAKDLTNAFRSANPKLETVTKENLEEALSACKHEPFILITGSLYLVGEALERLGFSPANTDERGLNEWTAPGLSR